MNIAYFLTLFPKYTETFVLREIEGVIQGGNEVTTYSLKTVPASQRGESSFRVVYSSYFSLKVLWHFITWWIIKPKECLAILRDISTGFSRNMAESWKALLVFPKIAHFAWLMRGNRPDIIHAHFACMATTGAWICSRLLSIPFSFTVHAFDIFMRQFDPFLEKKIVEASRIICISEYNRQYLLEHFYNIATPEKLVVVRCGVSNIFIDRPKNLIGPQEELLICSVGSLTEKKGHYFLVKAVKHIWESGGKIKLNIVGDGPLRSQLEELINNEGISSVVKLLGPLSNVKVHQLISESNLFALCCVIDHNGDRDGIPVALMEAMAMGVPVLSTYISGIPELITDGYNGFLVPERNVKAIVHTLNNLVNGKYNFEITSNACKTIEDAFIASNNARKLVNVFATIQKECKHVKFDNC